MARALLLFFCACLTFSAAAQLVEQIDVSIANVDVVVTDRDGKPVRGLTRDDFELFENGKPQAISNFYAVDSAQPAGSAAEAPPPPQQRPRLITLFIDIDEIDPTRRKQFFEGVGRFLDAAMRPGDYLTILTWVNRVKVVAPPTSDKKKVAEVMAMFAEANRWSEQDVMRRVADIVEQEAMRDAAIAASIGQEGPDPAAERAFVEWVAAEERCARIKRKAKEIRNLVLSLARVELQKVLIFASDDVSLRPLRDCSTQHELDALADTANAYGMTIHALHPPGVRDRAIRGPELGGVIPPPASPLAMEHERVLDQSGGLLHLAVRTGGHMAVGAGDSVTALERAAAELEAYYSLGYRLPPGSDDKARKIKVTTKNRSYRVRTRDSVMRLSDAARIRDHVVTSLYLPEAASPTMTFTPKIVAVRREGRYALLDVVISVPLKSLTVLGGRGSFSVFAAAGRELGDASDVTELKQDFESRSLPAGADAVSYSLTIRIRPDSRRLALAVRDNVSGDVGMRAFNLK